MREWMLDTVKYSPWILFGIDCTVPKIHESIGNDLFIRQGKNEGKETGVMDIPCSPVMTKWIVSH